MWKGKRKRRLERRESMENEKGERVSADGEAPLMCACSVNVVG